MVWNNIVILFQYEMAIKTSQLIFHLSTKPCLAFMPLHSLYLLFAWPSIYCTKFGTHNWCNYGNYGTINSPKVPVSIAGCLLLLTRSSSLLFTFIWDVLYFHRPFKLYTIGLLFEGKLRVFRSVRDSGSGFNLKWSLTKKINLRLDLHPSTNPKSSQHIVVFITQTWY